MIALFTDFGLEGPYLGQVRMVLHRDAPGVPVVDLFADLPAFDAVSAAYLLPAYSAPPVPEGAVILAVVDPGVGTGRAPLMVHAGGRWFVGPDNGLFSQVLAADPVDGRVWEILWRPPHLSASFHGRDLFAPVAAALALGGNPETSAVLAGKAVDARGLVGADWPRDRCAVAYIDRYGNAMTGLRIERIPADAVLRVGERSLQRAETFGAVAIGEAFWYGNSNGLVEIACNGARADQLLGLRIGTQFSVLG